MLHPFLYGIYRKDFFTKKIMHIQTPSSFSSKKTKILLFLIVLILLFGMVVFGIDKIHRLDKIYFHESIKDSIGKYLLAESWDNLPVLRPDADVSWMIKTTKTPLLIAHALGASGTAEANTLPAAKAALEAGFTHFEVDVWLDNSNRLRCHHGPELPLTLQDSDCTIDKLFTLLNKPNLWLILDIKTDFQRTGRRIIDAAISQKMEGKLIFQLYKPADLVNFSNWEKEIRLPAPILTAYMSHRSLNELLKQADHLHIKAFTFPLGRAPALSIRPSSVSLFVHPVHDCQAFVEALSINIFGIYTVKDLLCTTPN